MEMETILQWNIRGLGARFEDLKLLLNQFDSKVVALQECKLGEGQPAPREYSPFYSTRGGPEGRAALLIHRSVPCTPITLDTGLPAVAATITLGKTFHIVSLYLPPDLAVRKEELEHLFDQLPKPFLVVGDFNAHSPSWGDSRSDGRGRMIENLVAESNHIILNQKKTTFIHSAFHTPSSIDLAVASPSFAPDLEWSVHEDLCGSDHFPILLRLGTNVNNVYENNEFHFNFKKADWGRFGDLCESSIDRQILDEHCPAETFTKKVLDAARASIPLLGNQRKLVRVPWFDADCRNAIRERKKWQRKCFTNPTQGNNIKFRQAKAKCKYTIRQAKKNSWQNYVSTLNSNTPIKTIWKKIKKIKGKNNTQTTHLKKNNTIITDRQEHTNHLGETFSKFSASENYSAKFQKLKSTKEKQTLNFTSDNSEPYNKPFLLSELQASLKKSNQSAAGPDGIHYQLLTHLPVKCQEILLAIFNGIWDSGNFPPSWREATVVPIPKSNKKDLSDPSNFRPIALTSCLCKTLERIINARLVWVLETGDMFSSLQCGFRENHSTLDHLVRLESFIREAFARKKQVLAVFFDLEKAYDTAWKFGILADLHKLGFRGKLPIFIQNFLSERKFKVKVGGEYSDPFPQENGVPQGSILSPILFNLKINDIVKSVSGGGSANASLFVDDFAIYIEGKHLPHLERTMQLCINKVNKWVSENGFKFSASKTTCVHFHRQRIHKEPSLHLDGQPIPVAREVKFLGLYFDQKLNFKRHIQYVKERCQKALNVLRTVGHTDWGADRNTLLKLYRTLVRSKLDYGCIVYGSAAKHVLRTLDPVHHQGLRVALGAFRTSPVKSLYAEAGEASLENRRLKLSLNYNLKIRSLTENPCHETLEKSSPITLFETNKTDPPLYPRNTKHLDEMGVDLQHIDTQQVRKPPPWLEHRISVDLSLTSLGKNTTNPLVYRAEFERTRSEYAGHFPAYSDGSKDGNNAAAAAFFPEQPDAPASVRLTNNSSVFSAELEGILLAIDRIKKAVGRVRPFPAVIFVDSLSALQAVQNRNFKVNLVRRIFRSVEKLPPQVSISLVWIPAHVGIWGNEKADQLAKAALSRGARSKFNISWSDLKPKVNKYIKERWQAEWEQDSNNKLYEVLPVLGENLSTGKNRKEETVMARLRIGHTFLTHGHLLRKEDQPFCLACECPLTVKHILVECTDIAEVRNRYYKQTEMYRVFREVDTSLIVGFLKELGILSDV